MLIKNAILLDRKGRRNGWIQTDGSTIIATGEGEPDENIVASDNEIIDACGAYVCPGLIDSHVHFREPGLEYKATIAGESRAALAGGITTVYDMPNTKPATTTAEALWAKNRLGQETASTHYRAFFGATPGCMAELNKLRPGDTPGIKIFLGTSTGAMSAPAGRELEDILRWCADHGLPAVVHAEDNDIIAANTAAAINRYGSREAVPVSEHHRIRSAEACLRSAAAAVELAHRTGAHLHIAHISTAAEARELLDRGATAGKLVTAETTPMYLDPWLADENHRSGLHKINPAIKTIADAEELRAALADGRIDTIATDHAPHLLSEKEGGALTAASGAPSIQFAVPLMLTYLPIDLVVAKMSAGVADVFGLGDYGTLTPGQAADLSIITPTDDYIISEQDIISSCGWSPFTGRKLSFRTDAMVSR